LQARPWGLFTLKSRLTLSCLQLLILGGVTTVRNTQAYYDAKLITVVKSFIVNAFSVKITVSWKVLFWYQLHLIALLIWMWLQLVPYSLIMTSILTHTIAIHLFKYLHGYVLCNKLMSIDKNRGKIICQCGLACCANKGLYLQHFFFIVSYKLAQ